MVKTSTDTFRFTSTSPREWYGRYRRPKGNESAYHVTVNGTIHVQWRDSGYKFECPVALTADVQRLARAVNQAKQSYAGWAGGSFIINEFGQVICPIQQTSDRYLLGEAEGKLYFEDPWDDDVLLSIGDDKDLICGDDWERPYIGMQYQLHAGDFIYYWREDDEGGGMVRADDQDGDLIERLRAIRPHGGVRFIVNHHGIVLTKKHVEGKRWKPVYVGQIDYDYWFNREG